MKGGNQCSPASMVNFWSKGIIRVPRTWLRADLETSALMARLPSISLEIYVKLSHDESTIFYFETKHIRLG
jgi:hypothetical protein